MALPYKTIIMSCENTVKNISLYCCHIGRCLFSHIYPFWNCYIQTSKIDDIVSAAYIIIFITSISNTLRTSFARSGGNEFNILSFSYMAYNVILSADLAVIFFKYQASFSSNSRSSNGLLILLLKVSAMWTYLSVVLILLCPISSFTILMSVPCSSR